jgi:FkbM family methyltransferase
MRRFVGWQLRSRVFSRPLVADFVNDSKLLIRRGMTGATGNLYCGLHEFEDMSFVLHLLREDDLFCDIGANVGSYTVISSAGIGARTLAFEPVPSTYSSLLDNIEVNGIQELVKSFNMGLGNESGTLDFTTGLDCVNHVATGEQVDDGQETTTVDVARLDDVVGDEPPCLIKIDVEGFEANVLTGAQATLSNDKVLAVVMELNGSGARYGFDDDALHATMLAHGFFVCRYHPFERRLELVEERNQEGNSLYVKDLAAVAQRVSDAPPYRVNGSMV